MRLNGERVLLNFSWRWPHSFFMQLRRWDSISRHFIVAQVKFPKVKIQTEILLPWFLIDEIDSIKDWRVGSFVSIF